MSWNYRIIKTITNGVFGTEHISYAIHEVYYDKDGNPNACSQNAIAPYGEDSVDSLKADFELMKKAFEKPVLDMILFNSIKNI